MKEEFQELKNHSPVLDTALTEIFIWTKQKWMMGSKWPSTLLNYIHTRHYSISFKVSTILQSQKRGKK